MKKVKELKNGMKVLIPFEAKEIEENEFFSFQLFNKTIKLTFTKDCRYLPWKFPMEVYEHEEIPTLTRVEMEVSDDGANWTRINIIGKIGDHYVDVVSNHWRHARPIQKTVTLEIPESELTDELRKYLKS